MGFSRQEYWSGLPFPSPGNLPDPGVEPGQILYHLRHQGEWKCPSNALTSSDEQSQRALMVPLRQETRLCFPQPLEYYGCLHNIPFLIIAELLDPKEAAGWIEFESQSLNIDNPEEFYVYY